MSTNHNDEAAIQAASPNAIKLVAISDTHSLHTHTAIPPGDILIHAGDMTAIGRWQELENFAAFLRELPHLHKIVIAGNHDGCMEDIAKVRQLLDDCHYLVDNAVTIFGIKFYGTPWQPCHWAFHADWGAPLQSKWQAIPEDTDVLITHAPPRDILDLDVNVGKHEGCPDLRDRVLAIAPKLHIFGHVHYNGIAYVGDTTFVNASICDEQYRPSNQPIVLEYPLNIK